MLPYSLPGGFSDNPWGTSSEDLARTAVHAPNDVHVPLDHLPVNHEDINASHEPPTSIYTTGVIAGFNNGSLVDDSLISRENTDMDSEMEPKLAVVLQGKTDHKRHHQDDAASDFSSSLRDEVRAREETIGRLHTKLRQHDQARKQSRHEQRRMIDLYEKREREAAKNDQQQQQDIQAMLARKDHEMTMLRQALQRHEELRNKLEVTQQLQAQNHALELNEFRTQFLTQMEQFQASRATEIEMHVQQEVKKVASVIQADKERELANIASVIQADKERELANIASVIQADKERELANIEQRFSRLRSPPARAVPRRSHAPDDNLNDRMVTTPEPFQTAPEPDPKPHLPQPRPPFKTPTHSRAYSPSLDAIKRIRKTRGISHRTHLIGIETAENDSIRRKAAEDMSGSSSGDDNVQPRMGSNANMADPTVIAEVITKGMEALFRNIFSNGTGQSTKRSPRRKRTEDDAVQREKATEPSQHRDFILSEIRRLFKDKLGITQDLDFITHEPANLEDVHAYEYEDGPSPDMENIAFNLSCGSSSPWNMFILDAFRQELQRRCVKEKWAIKRSDGYLREAFKERYKRLRTVWRNAQPKVTSDGVVETPTEMETRLADERFRTGKESRQNNRRRNKYHRRITMLDGMVALKADAQDDDLPAWQWLQSLIKTLGENGMSSEESAIENGVEEVLRVKNMEWRRNIDRELEIIDLQRIVDNDIFSQRGSRPLIRKRAHNNLMSTRRAVTGLPLALYDSAWTSHLTQRQIEGLDISEQSFRWMQVVAA